MNALKEEDEGSAPVEIITDPTLKKRWKMMNREYKPLSVRHGNRRKRLIWWFIGRREALALCLAPWLRPMFTREEEE